MSKFTHFWHLKRAAQILKSGGVIAYPTEAVWGLGCDPWNRGAVERLLRLKSRSMEKGLILACGQIDHLDFLLSSLSDDELQTLSKSWPGPNTWLIPDPRHTIPQWIKGGHNTVAVRVSEHSLIKDLSKLLGRPIVSTSANPAGSEPAMNALRVRQYFGGQLDYIVPGATGGAQQPSRIRSLKTGMIIRS